MQPAFALIPASPESAAHFSKLSAVSLASPINPETLPDRSKPFDKGLSPKRAEAGIFFDSPAWEDLSPSAKLELLWLETARDISLAIGLKQRQATLYMAYVAVFGNTLAQEVEEYLMVSSKEVLVHAIMFEHYRSHAQLPEFAFPDSPAISQVVNMLRNQAQTTPPIVGVLWLLLCEWVITLQFADGAADQGAEPQAQKMLREHQIEQGRHLDFGRRIIEDHLRSAPAFAGYLKELFRDVPGELFEAFTSPAPILALASTGAWADELKSVLADVSHWPAANEGRFKEICEWLQAMGLRS